MKSFLKVLGQIFSVFVKVEPEVAAVGAVVTPLLGSGQGAQEARNALNDFTAMGTVVIQMETALQGKAGTDKLAAAIPLVGNIVRTSELVAGKKIGDEALFTKAIQEYTQATVDLLNSIHPDEAKA